MATLSIREYEHINVVSGGIVPVAQEPAVTKQTVAIGGGSLQSAAFNERTRFVRLYCDVACSLEFGVNPTAAANSCSMGAGQTEYFGVQPGHKVAVITN